MSQENTPGNDTHTDEQKARIDAYTGKDADALAAMVKGASVEVLEILAANPSTDAETLDAIARKSAVGSQAWLNLADNKNTLSSTLDMMYRKIVGSVRTKKLLDLISNQDIRADREDAVLVKMGANEATPLNVLRKIASHRSFEVRFSVTSNKGLPVSERVDILRQAIEELPVDSQFFIASLDHSDLPNGIRAKKLAELCKGGEETPWLAMAQMKHLNMETIGFLLGSKDEDVQEKLYLNQDLPEAAYRFLAADKDFHYLQILAENPATPADIIENLATNTVEAFEVIEGLKKFEYIALSLSRNPSIPLETLSELSERLDGHVSDSILKALFQAVKDKTKQV